MQNAASQPVDSAEALDSPAPDSIAPRPAPRLLDQVRERIRVLHYSRRTEETYVAWIRRFIVFHGKRHPSALGPREVEAFLSALAVEGNVAASTQNQARSAILFLYREVLQTPLPWLTNVSSAKQPQRMPVVLSEVEARALLGAITAQSPTYGLVAGLLYGSGLRILEALRLRVKDIEFDQRQIVVREGKGAKDRVTTLPASLAQGLRLHLAKVQAQFEQDLALDRGGVYLPFALARKYPNAECDWAWRYVFPSDRFSRDPRSGAVRRHHFDESGVQRAFKTAARQVGITKFASPHTLRHYLACRTM